MDLLGCPDEPTLWMRHEEPSGFGLCSASGWKRLVCRRRIVVRPGLLPNHHQATRVTAAAKPGAQAISRSPAGRR